jgi:hypothetical protein
VAENESGKMKKVAMFVENQWECLQFSTTFEFVFQIYLQQSYRYLRGFLIFKNKISKADVLK